MYVCLLECMCGHTAPVWCLKKPEGVTDTPLELELQVAVSYPNRGAGESHSGPLQGQHTLLTAETFPAQPTGLKSVPVF